MANEGGNVDMKMHFRDSLPICYLGVGEFSQRMFIYSLCDFYGLHLKKSLSTVQAQWFQLIHALMRWFDSDPSSLKEEAWTSKGVLLSPSDSHYCWFQIKTHHFLCTGFLLNVWEKWLGRAMIWQNKSLSLGSESAWSWTLWSVLSLFDEMNLQPLDWE